MRGPGFSFLHAAAPAIALKYGNEFIRRAFYIVVSVLIAKTFKDAYL